MSTSSGPGPHEVPGSPRFPCRTSRGSGHRPLGTRGASPSSIGGSARSNRPFLEQRRFVKFSPGMCRPLVKRVPAPWGGAFHSIRAPFHVDRDIWMLHLKYADVPMLEIVAERRRMTHELEGRGHPKSFWPMGAEVLKRRLAAWTSDADATGAVAPFDPDEPDLDGLIQSRVAASGKRARLRRRD